MLDSSQADIEQKIREIGWHREVMNVLHTEAQSAELARLTELAAAEVRRIPGDAQRGSAGER